MNLNVCPQLKVIGYAVLRESRRPFLDGPFDYYDEGSMLVWPTRELALKRIHLLERDDFLSPFEGAVVAPVYGDQHRMPEPHPHPPADWAHEITLE